MCPREIGGQRLHLCVFSRLLRGAMRSGGIFLRFGSQYDNMRASLDLDFGAAKGNEPVAHLFYNGGGLTAVTRFLAGAGFELLWTGACFIWWNSAAKGKER